ncbi:hypothetical protein LTR85_001316 [Meristemomyces frigidus]|nr:hypothetical protein LTR85_001316 [Meristemomyces frigidus]
MGDESHADLNATAKMCGEPGDDSTPTFGMLDELLLSLIETRLAKSSGAATLPKVAALPSVPSRWTRAESDVPTGKNGPNKQQRGWIQAEKLEFAKDSREGRRERRESCEDWISVALSDLVEEREYLKRYGVGENFNWDAKDEPNAYFKDSIAKLEELEAARGGAERSRAGARGYFSRPVFDFIVPLACKSSEEALQIAWPSIPVAVMAT